jgi:ferrochelatase
LFLRTFKYLWPERYLPESVGDDPVVERLAPRLGGTGVLLVNLGTPDRAERASIRRYLAEFLSDPRVIEIPRWLWMPVLHLLVLTLRPQKLVPRYRGVWLDEGSPLLVYSRRQAAGLERRLAQHAEARGAGAAVKVELGMRYGRPSVADGISALRRHGCDRILVLPLYPQYAASTTATAVDAVAAYMARLRDQPELRFIKRFNEDPGYIAALAGRIRGYWETHGRPQKLVLSFHGLPRYSIELGDPYYQDCLATARALRPHLDLPADDVEVTFQSRFGSARWLEPYTEPTLKELARQGVTEVDVICPGFVADCLETLEEIQVECRDAFLAAGGLRLRYIPALNDEPAWLDAMAALVERNLAGWE